MHQENMVNLGRRSVLITISVVIAIAVIVVLCLYYIPVQKEINYTFDGYLIYRGNSSSGKKCTVSVEGKHKNFLLKNNEFEGIFAVDGVMMYSKPMKIVFQDGVGVTDYIGQEHLMYLERKLSNGSIALNEACDKIMISSCFNLENRVESADENFRCVIVGPASSRKEADAIVLMFKEKGALKNSLKWVDSIY